MVDPKDIERAREIAYAAAEYFMPETPNGDGEFLDQFARDVLGRIESARAEGDAAGYARGRAEAFKEAAQACREQQVTFGSNEYATGQPLSSFGERFACGRCAEEIALLASTPAGTGEPT